jgi:hypothetical protein
MAPYSGLPCTTLVLHFLISFFLAAVQILCTSNALQYDSALVPYLYGCLGAVRSPYY